MDASVLAEELEGIRARNLYRRLRVLTYSSPVHASFEGKELLLFCGNDYLGLSSHPAMTTAAIQALQETGTGARASRLISGTSCRHEDLEKTLATWKGKPAALVYSAGYLANLGVLSALAGQGDMILLDKLCHASLIDGARLSGAELRVFPHKNYERCEEILKRSRAEYRRVLLVTDTLFSMDGDLADLSKLAELKKRYDAILIADDAHATGVMGATGAGAAEGSPELGDIDVLTGTLSKALGCLGGFAAASEEWIDYLINFSRPFIFATALPPHLCTAIETGIGLIREGASLREKLWENTRYVHEGLKKAGLALEPLRSPIVPLPVGDEKKAVLFSEKLLELGILIPAVRYPTVPKGKARLRLTLSAAHQKTDLDKLLKTLQNMEFNEDIG